MWFIAGFYLIAAQLFSNERFTRRYMIAYAAGLAVVVIFFLARTGGAGLLNQQFAHSACYPFYNDHTSFGASMAFLMAPLTVILFRKSAKVVSRIFCISADYSFCCRVHLFVQQGCMGEPDSSTGTFFHPVVQDACKASHGGCGGIYYCHCFLGRMDLAEDGQYNRGFIG